MVKSTWAGEPRNLTLVELGPDDCRYPFGDRTIVFCGHPKVSGSSYCTEHHALCWVKPTAPKFKARSFAA